MYGSHAVGMMEPAENMEIDRASTLAKVLARDRALEAQERKDAAIEKGRLTDNEAYPGSKHFRQAVGVIAQYLSELVEAKISSIRDAYAQTDMPLTGETVDDAMQAIHTSLETVISARVGSWGGTLALVQQRTGQTVAGGAEALAEAGRELRRQAARLYQKAEDKLDVILQSSLAASERNNVVEFRNHPQISPQYDVFISHATEDKPYVEPLVEALEAAGIKVWFDKTTLEWGDDLRPSIDRGLANCRYGIVVLSRAFLGKKKWTEYELNSLFALERPGRKIILPIWHGITRDDLLQYSAGFADRLAKISSKDSYEDIVESLLNLVGRSKPQTATMSMAPLPNVPEPAKPNPDGGDARREKLELPAARPIIVSKRYGKGVLKDHMGYTGLAVVNDGEQPAYDITIHNVQINESAKLTFHGGHTERLTKNDGEAFYPAFLEARLGGTFGSALFDFMRERGVPSITVPLTYRDSNNNWFQTDVTIERDVQKSGGLRLGWTQKRIPPPASDVMATSPDSSSIARDPVPTTMRNAEKVLSVMTERKNWKRTDLAKLANISDDEALQALRALKDADKVIPIDVDEEPKGTFWRRI